MSGEIIGVMPPRPPKHSCTPPVVTQDWVVWRCSCGKAWRVTPTENDFGRWLRFSEQDVKVERQTSLLGVIGAAE